MEEYKNGKSGIGTEVIEGICRRKNQCCIDEYCML